MTEHDWTTQPQLGLEAAIAAFKTEFPGWYYSVCECQVSCDATIAPTSESPDIARIPRDDRFNSGFNADLAQPSSLAEALTAAMLDARAALKADGAFPSGMVA